MTLAPHEPYSTGSGFLGVLGCIQPCNSNSNCMRCRPVGSTIAIAPSDEVYDIFADTIALRVGAQTFK